MHLMFYQESKSKLHLNEDLQIDQTFILWYLLNTI